MNPVLWLAAISLRLTREDLYRSLIDKLDTSAGASIERLDEIFEQWARRDRERNDSRAPVMGYIHRQLENGQSLASAMRPFIPVDESLIIESGEIRGRLAEALELAVRNLEASSKMRSSVASAMAQPVLGLSSLLILSVVLGVFMWPDILRGVPLHFWPDWTHPAIKSQLWLGERWPWLVALSIPVGLYLFSLDRWTGKLRTWVDRLPPWSIHRSQLAATFLGVLAALVESGNTVRESLVLMRERSSPYMAWRITQVIRRLDSGGNEGVKALRTGFFSRQIMDRVEDASTNRSFGLTLRHVGTRATHMIIKAVEIQANGANLVFILIVGAIFLYTTGVIVFGMQEATEALTKSFGTAI